MTQRDDKERDAAHAADFRRQQAQQLLAAYRDGALTRLMEHLTSFERIFPVLFTEQIQTLRIKIDLVIDTAMRLEKTEENCP